MITIKPFDSDQIRVIKPYNPKDSDLPCMSMVRVLRSIGKIDIEKSKQTGFYFTRIKGVYITTDNDSYVNYTGYGETIKLSVANLYNKLINQKDIFVTQGKESKKYYYSSEENIFKQEEGVVYRLDI